MIFHLIDVGSPWRKVKAKDCVAKLCNKSGWAEFNGRRFKIGVSAFQTVEEATRHRTERLERMVNDYGFKGKRPRLWDAAKRELDLVKSTFGR